ncbi:unnamed protein product [Adineta ricciae]|uniref:Uncharacterized protein n=1 Tax=Adineta ricciae TaxID=249248 RepID=A0A814PUX9_ADIRI|nr:unnamed protein product [Adineta ricciae]CAF1368679.1 unnamed protein product [Adineta ricciae]
MSKAETPREHNKSQSNSPTHSKPNGASPTSPDIKSKMKGIFARQAPRTDPLTQVVVCKRLAKMPMIFLAKRRQIRKIGIENLDQPYTDDNAGLMATLVSPEAFAFEHEAGTFDEYTQKLEEALTMLRNMKREEYESQTALKVLRFLENLIHQPKEWISGAKLKLSEMKFPETAMTFMHSYKEKGYLVRRIVFVHSILLYNSMSNFTDHEFDKEGLIRMQAAGAGFIEFACEILKDPSFLESLKKCYVIDGPPETVTNDDFNNYQKILYICDAALTILYNMANLPELKIHFRECNATNIIAEYTKLPSDTVVVQTSETCTDDDYITSVKELQDVVSAIRVTSSLLLPLIINEDEDNILAANTSDVLPLLSEMIRMYNQNGQRFYGFSFIELVDGLSKLMVRGRTHKFIDQNLVNILLNILEDSNQDVSLLECVSNAILNASFDEKVQTFLDSERAIEIITSTRNNSPSQLVQKNCEAILWTLNRLSHRRVSPVEKTNSSKGHIMISYNRSVTAMCLKIRDRLKTLNYTVWLDVDNINGGVLASMAEAPRFRPYGWLGIIKGAKIHVDFATLPFEEAFAILIREIETIKQDDSSLSTSNDDKTNRALHQLHSTGISTTDTLRNALEPKASTEIKFSLEPPRHIRDWDVSAVKTWLEGIGLMNLERAFVNIDGKLLWRLYQMKQTATNSYYKFLDKYFDRIQLAHMSDTLKFDYELDLLFQ